MKYFSMFSGIGGFERGIDNAWKSIQRTKWSSVQSNGNKPIIESRNNKQSKTRWNREFKQPENIGFSEVDKYASQIYKKHFNHKEYGNVKNINWKNVEDFELLVGGFPCQAFSIAGKRRGFDDTRGTLFFEIARCLKEKRPRLILLENVKGLLSHDKGRTFGTILATLSELGYDLQWQVLNSKNFGVPQNRERVFIVGHIRETSRPEVFPIGEGNELSKTQNFTEGRRSQAKISNTIRGSNMKADHTFIIHGDSKFFRIRRLTPTECERLQGFPDGWTEGISDTQRYKCLGNAVTVNVIEAIMEKLLAERVR